MTIRTRLSILTIVGLAITMAAWGWIQLKALETILIDLQGKRLSGVAETTSTYYQHFPSRSGLAALDMALKEQIQTDERLARIDIFSISSNDVDTLAGAARVHYEWPDPVVESAADTMRLRILPLKTESGPALGVLLPILSEKYPKVVVGVIGFSRTNAEILASARYLMVFSSLGLLMVILLVLALGYRWLIGRPLGVIIDTIDEFQTGKYTKRIPTNRQDEWGQLAHHFNSMAYEIEQVIASNKALTKQLEGRVQEATHRVVQLQKQVTQLQQLTALGYLTATLSHDLGTPLHSIAGLARLLLEGQDWQPDVRRKLELIVQQTQRLHEVIQNVRRVTRLPEPHFDFFNVRDLLTDTQSLIEPMIRKSPIRLTIQTGRDLPLLYADRHRIQTALFNLIQNAMEAMEDEGKIIISATTASTEEGKVLQISVQDNGPGIPEDLMEKICDPFFTTHQDEGLRGFGLAIVQDIMKAHSGKVTIRSRPKVGTTVILSFPITNLINN
jgi:signal transduction histidine kinase